LKNCISILFTIPNFITAGSGREMLNIVGRLNPDRFAPAVCVLSKDSSLETEIEHMGFPLIEGPFVVQPQPLYTLPYRVWKAAQVFRPHKFKIWHSFHWSSDYTEPLIARMAGAQAWIYTKKNMNWDRRAWGLRSLFASRIVARNKTMMDRFFAHRWYRFKTNLVPGGADTKRFSPDVPPRLGLRNRFGIKSSEIVVVCVAQLVRVKGHPTLLEAIAQVDGVHLWLAGKTVDEAYAQELDHLAKELAIANRVFFLGQVSDVSALLAEVDIFVLPTWSRWEHEEGCPVALLEAMAAGKCCIATDVAGSRDLIEDKVNGILVKPENSKEMAKALRDLTTSPDKIRKLGAEARKRIETEFTLEKEVSSMQALYEEVLES
jgi:glycosyltransferase involved in cell wall biosynthesis